jgi:predicted peptidase
MKRITRALLLLAGLFMPAFPTRLQAQEGAIDGFRPAIFKPIKGPALPYRLYSPADPQPGIRYPLILFLHGFEALGRDNKKQIAGKDFAGSHLWTNPEVQGLSPSFVLAPQCPLGASWASLFSRKPTRYLKQAVILIRELESSLPIDPNRIYVTGQSLGGFGTWAAISEFPRVFAAAAPVCGGGRTRKAAVLASKPVWAFHGSADPIVWPMESRRMISAIQKAGGNPIYTEFPLVMHNAWDLAYSNPSLVVWLYLQRLNRPLKGD